MMEERKRYLLCPQCGVHRYYLRAPDGSGDIFFHVDWSGKPFPTVASEAALDGLDFSEIRCCGCSWVGPIRKLVKVFTG